MIEQYEIFHVGTIDIIVLSSGRKANILYLSIIHDPSSIFIPLDRPQLLIKIFNMRETGSDLFFFYVTLYYMDGMIYVDIETNM